MVRCLLETHVAIRKSCRSHGSFGRDIAGDLARARAIQSAFNMAQKDLYKYGAYGSVKRCLSLMGIEAGDCRPPFLPLGSARDEHLSQTLRQLDDIRDKWGLPVTTSQ